MLLIVLQKQTMMYQNANYVNKLVGGMISVTHKINR